mmetsp:Transcript_28275/g.64681  ORF Transcript_28275/g.64681 Transcript_28275/m.64681 type:complete len:255 (-) Transcript_28275:557-1321(-)
MSELLEMSERENIFFQAKLAHRAERYDEMISKMNKVVHCASAAAYDLTIEEREMLYIAYKCAVDSRRASIRVVEATEQDCKKTDNHEEEDRMENLQLMSEYKLKIERELVTFCKEIIGIIDESLIINSSSAEAKAFYLKIKADFFRYMADSNCSVARKAHDAYQKAYIFASSELHPTNPRRLGVASDLSLFYYNNMRSPQKAYIIAKETYDEAHRNIRDIPNNASYKDSTAIMQLLRDNITRWSDEIGSVESPK